MTDIVDGGMSDKTPLTDPLRTRINLRGRIADALKAEAERRGIYRIADFDFPFMADAVIADLGLRQETTYAWRNGRSHPAGTRYATKWEKP